MILSTEQTSKSVKISYIEGSERKFLEVPKENFWYWEDAKKGKDEDKDFKSYMSKPVTKKYYAATTKSTVSKFAIWEWINSQPEETQNILYKLAFPKMLFCDIETEVIEGFPDVAVAREKVTAITYSYIDKNEKIQSISVGYKEDFLHEKQKSMQAFVEDYFSSVHNSRPIVFKYKKVKDERDLLRFFVEICKKFDIITGWNFINFDWAYLKRRMMNLNIDFTPISPTGTLDRYGNPNHFVVIDYMQVFEKNDKTIRPKESMRLEWISNAVLGVGKLKYGGTLQEMYDKDYEKYILYNNIDTINVLLIHDTCKTLNALLALSNMSGCEVTKCQSAVNITEGLLSKGYLEENKVIPRKFSDKVKEEYVGAYVKDPITGMYAAATCFDFSSLYPSIARQLNLSPESFLGKDTPDFTKEFGKDDSFDMYKKASKDIDRSDLDKIISVTGCQFRTEESTLKKIFDNLYDKRKTDQHRFKTCDKLAHELKQKLKQKS
jgi:DNA polymerase elongation subunit (family B)